MLLQIRAQLPRCAHCRRKIRDGAVLTVTLPTGTTRWHLNRACRDYAPEDRTPAFPAGRGCPPGCCPICGQHEPDQLVEGCHEACVEWLGYVPRPSAFGVTVAEVGTALAAAFATPRVKPTTASAASLLAPCGCGWTRLGCPACYTPYCPSCEQRHVLDCGRRWERQQTMLQKPTPPPGPGSATKERPGPSARQEYRRRSKELDAELKAIRASLDAMPPLPELPPLHVDPLLIQREER